MIITTDELSSFTSNGNTYSYTYDAEGLRSKKINLDGTSTRYHCDNYGRVIAESNANNLVTAQIIWGDKPLARKIGNTFYYYLYNGHGDVIYLTDISGNIVNSYTYDEWGNIVSKQEQISNPIRYVGEYYDEESGLYYLRARYYDPAIGRFISKDSVKGQIDNPLSFKPLYVL
ncbi:MAG: RHS repeat-associated core domain-containing protein [Syntrophomonas sp.]